MEVDETSHQDEPTAPVPAPIGAYASPVEDKAQVAETEDVLDPVPEPVTKVEDTEEDVLMSTATVVSETDVKVPAESIESSPPPHRPATCTSNGVAKEPNGLPNYKTKYIMSGHTRSISSVKFNPEGSILASAGECVVRACLSPRN